MKTLKRPMFRKGGEVGGGIMTGVMRENYAVGSARERLARVAAEYPSSAVDPLSQFLIQGGLNLASQPASGSGIIADAAAAFKEPTAGLFKGLEEKAQIGKKLALEGEMLDIAQDQAMALAQLKKKQGLGLQKDFSPQRAYEELLKTRTESAGKLTSFQKPNIEQAYPRATSEYDVYVMRNLRATDDPQGKKIAAGNMGFVPFDQKTGRFDYNKMIAGGYYYDPRQRSFVTRKPGIEGEPDQFFLVDAYTFKETLIER